jgi:hypothetical protein
MSFAPHPEVYEPRINNEDRMHPSGPVWPGSETHDHFQSGAPVPPGQKRHRGQSLYVCVCPGLKCASPLLKRKASSTPTNFSFKGAFCQINLKKLDFSEK